MSKHILVVDDSAVERQNIVDILSNRGLVISIAESGEQGIEMAKQLKPDLIIMDVVMNGINGFQATREISSNDETSHIPVVMCTTKGQNTDKMWAEKQGAKGYLVKPVEQTELLAAVSKFA